MAQRVSPRWTTTSAGRGVRVGPRGSGAGVVPRDGRVGVQPGSAARAVPGAETVEPGAGGAGEACAAGARPPPSVSPTRRPAARRAAAGAHRSRTRPASRPTLPGRWARRLTTTPPASQASRTSGRRREQGERVGGTRGTRRADGLDEPVGDDDEHRRKAAAAAVPRPARATRPGRAGGGRPEGRGRRGARTWSHGMDLFSKTSRRTIQATTCASKQQPNCKTQGMIRQ